MTAGIAWPTITSMGTETDQARLIAERIARRVSPDALGSSGESAAGSELSSELAAMRASLGELQRRLGQIEMRVRSGDASGPVRSTIEPSLTPRTHSPWLAGVNYSVGHPSEEKFGIEEATVSELVDFFQNEKQCSVEPGGKPCDHCSMCSSRGF
jgi:hypothetical protein